MIVQESDFKGVYKISVDNYSGLSDYIDMYEPIYLDAIIPSISSDLQAHPTYTKYADILAAGLKNALIGFIYFHYVSDNFAATVVGNVSGNNENSTPITSSQNAQITINRYNTSGMLVNGTVASYLNDNQVIEETITGSSEITGVYTLLMPSTKWLELGTLVYIGNQEYTVNEITENTSIKIIDATGKDFTNEVLFWYPYNQESATKIEIIAI